MRDKPFDSPSSLYNPNALRAASWSPWLWASTPALALAALMWALRGAALPLPVGVALPALHSDGSALASGTDLVIPASETLVVARSSTSAVLLRGRLQPPAGTPLLAPGGGQISQVLARPGQMVRAGQALMEISRGVASARQDSGPPPGIMRAERDQTVAEHQGEAAQQKVTLAHMRLAAAQTRVQAAQERVAQAHDLVRRLQNGDDVSRDDLSTPTPAPTPAPPEKTMSAAASATATRDSRHAQKLAGDAEVQAASARRAAQAAEEDARAKKVLADKAQSALDDLRAQAKSDSPKSDSTKSDSDSKNKKDGDSKNSGTTNSASSGTNKTSDSDGSTPHASTHSGSTHVVGLRAAQRRADVAQASWKDAQSHAESVRADSDKAQSRAKLLRGQSNDAVRQAASALQNLHVFAGENSGPTLRDTASTQDASSRTRQARATDSTRGKSGEKITAREAARIVRAAVSESETAVLNAERIQREVADLERPVGKTARRVESSKKSFESAQQQMWSVSRSATRANVTPVTAPAAGVLLWIAQPARDVQSGEPLGAVGRADRLQVVLRDTSNAWKTTRVGATVMALVQPDGAPTLPAVHVQKTSASIDANAKGTPLVASSADASALRGVPTLARVLAVAPPSRAGAPASITVAVHNPRHASTLDAPENAANRPDANYGLASRVFEPGTPVVCSLAQPSSGARQIVVPVAAVRRDADHQAVVAVLTPVENESTNDQPTNQAAASSEMCRIEWRKVELGRGDGFQNVVLSGLKSGDRIALRPAALYTFTLAHGAAAILRVEQA